MPAVHRHVTQGEFCRGARHVDHGHGGVVYNGVRYDEVSEDPITGGFRLTRHTSGWSPESAIFDGESMRPSGPPIGNRFGFMGRFDGFEAVGSRSGRWAPEGPVPQTYSATMRDVRRQVRAQTQRRPDRAIDVAYDELANLSITKMEMISKLYGGPFNDKFYDFETGSWRSTIDKPQPKRMLEDTVMVYDAPIGPRANFKRKAQKTVDVEVENVDAIAASILRDIEVIDGFSNVGIDP